MSLRNRLRRWTAAEQPRNRDGWAGGLGRNPLDLERGLWTVAIGSSVADLALTVVGRSVGLVEVNPVARALLVAHGTLGLVALKVLVLGFAACVWTALPGRYAAVVPVALALPTVPAVAYNAVLVALALL